MKPELIEIDRRHDSLVAEVLEFRKSLPPGSMAISDKLSETACRFIEDIRKTGNSLYEVTDREFAISLMSYWIHALYRAEWYQRNDTLPPRPILDEHDPKASKPLTDSEYPFPHLKLDSPDVTDESRNLWSRQAAFAAEQLMTRGLIGVTGAAGSGRSHFIDFGLLPELCEKTKGSKRVVKMTLRESCSQRAGKKEKICIDVEIEGQPGITTIPADELEKTPALLTRPVDDAGRCIVVVHDLSKLFTLDEDPARLSPGPRQIAFMNCLGLMKQTGHWVAIDLQQAFLGKINGFPELAKELDEWRGGVGDGWIVIHHEATELTKFIVSSADRVGLSLEAGLTERLVADHLAESAALPLLLFTLRRLWLGMLEDEKTDGGRRNMLTWKCYQIARGGRLGLEKAAEEAWNEWMSTDCKPRLLEEVPKVIFTEMVRLLPGAGWWLTSVKRDDLLARIWKLRRGKRKKHRMPPAYLRRVMEQAIQCFSNTGIILEHEDTLALVHPAVVARWSRLVTWIEEKREIHRFTWRLRSDARDWTKTLQKSGFRCRWDAYFMLWRGSRLREALRMDPVIPLGRAEKKFLSVSLLAWRLQILGWMTVALVLIAALVERGERMAAHLLTVYAERGAYAQTEGDVASAAPWIGAAYAPNRERNERANRWKDYLPPFLRSERAKQRMNDLRISAEMALDRFPEIVAMSGVTQRQSFTNLSTDGKFALLGRQASNDSSKQGTGTGAAEVFLWDVALDPKGAGMRKLDLPKGPGEARIISTSFLENGDSSVVVACNLADGTKGWVGVWNDGQTGKPSDTLSFDRPVSSLAFRKIDDIKLLVIGHGGHAPPSDLTRQAAKYTHQGNVRSSKAEQPKPEPTYLSIRELPLQPGASPAGEPTDLAPTFSGPIGKIVISDQGTIACAADSKSGKGETINLFEHKPGHGWKLVPLQGQPDLPVADLAFSPGSKAHPGSETLAAAGGHPESSEGSVWLAVRKDGEWSSRTEKRNSAVTRVLFSPDEGRFLASTGADGKICIWQPKGYRSLSPLWELDEGGWIWSAAWSPDGRWLATGNRDRHLRLWDVTERILAFPKVHHGETVGAIHFTPDGLNFLATTLTSAKMWTVRPRDSNPAIEAPGKPAPQGQNLYWGALGRAPLSTMSANGHCALIPDVYEDITNAGVTMTSLRIWVGTDRKPRELEVGGEDGNIITRNEIRDVAISWEGKAAAVIRRESATDWLHVWDTESGKELNRFNLIGKADKVMLFGSRGKALNAVVFRETGKVVILPVEVEKSNGITPDSDLDPGFAVKVASYSPGNDLLALGGEDSSKVGRLAVFHASKRELVVSSSVHNESVTAIAFDSSGSKIVTGSADDRLKVHTLDPHGKLISLADGYHTADVTSVRFLEGNDRILSSSIDTTAAMWKLPETSGQPLELILRFEHSKPVQEVALSKDGRWLATGGGNETRLWSTLPPDQNRIAQALAVLPQSLPVKKIAFVDEGLRVIAAGRGKVEAKQWRIHSGSDTPEKIRNKLELVSARRLIGNRIDSLEAKDLHALWLEIQKDDADNSAAKNHPVAAKTSRDEHRQAFFTSAAAGNWHAAKFHLLRCSGPAENARYAPGQSEFEIGLKVAVALRDPHLMVRLIENLQTLETPDPQIDEKEATARIQLARIGTSQERDIQLEKARNLLARLQKNNPNRKFDYLLRLAEVEVVARNWEKAAEFLQEAINGTQDTTLASSALQRLGPVHLVSDKPEKWKATAARWAESEIMKQPGDGSTRIMWMLVMGKDGEPETYERLASSASSPGSRGPSSRQSYAQLNTHALAQLRDKKNPESAEAARGTIKRAIQDYEENRDPLNPAMEFEGRPTDWIVEALIYLELHRKAVANKETMNEAYAEMAKDRINAVEKQLAVPSNFKEWRATWNCLDLEILLNEARNDLANLPAPR